MFLTHVSIELSFCAIATYTNISFHWLQDLTLQEAETIALSILKQVMEEKVNKYCFWKPVSVKHKSETWRSITLLTLTFSIVDKTVSLRFQVTPNNVDIAKVAPTYHLYTPAEVEAVISRLWEVFWKMFRTAVMFYFHWHVFVLFFVWWGRI